MKTTAFEAYCLFLSLKFHFGREKYDFFKYKGKVKTTRSTFDTKGFRFFFEKLSKKYEKEELQNYFVANFSKNRNWPVIYSQIIDEESHETYIAYVKRQQSFTYIFGRELEDALKTVKKPSELFKAKKYEYPPIITLCASGTVSVETLVVLNEFVGFFDKFDKKFGEDDVFWSGLGLTAKKLRPFLHYDKDKIKAVLKERLLNNGEPHEDSNV